MSLQFLKASPLVHSYRYLQLQNIFYNNDIIVTLNLLFKVIHEHLKHKNINFQSNQLFNWKKKLSELKKNLNISFKNCMLLKLHGFKLL